MMIHGVAIGGAANAAAFPASGPMLWVGESPWPEVAVLELNETGPLAERTLVMRPPANKSAKPPDRASAAKAVAYDDGAVRWRLLAEGTVHLERDRSKAGAVEHTWRLRDAWTSRLDEPAGSAWSERYGRLVPVALPRLDHASRGNRSTGRHDVNGSSVYVPTAVGGERWRPRDAIEFLAASLHLPIVWDDAARELDVAALPQTVDMTGSLREALKPLLEAHGLALRVEFPGDDASHRRLHVVSVDTARRVVVPAAASGKPAVVESDQRGDADPATLWIARGGINEVESTFPLVGGWDPALESAGDAQYDRTQSTDFPTHRNVFRTWVLNEDGRYSEAPYHRGPAPDTAELFDNPDASPQPLRFRGTLSLDAAGQTQPPLVEITLDSGATWSPYPGRAVVLEERAGVFLDDDTLPAGWIAAVRDGSGQLRVTATLRDPRALCHRRWDGNALRGSTQQRSVEAGRAFQRRRVDPSSVLHGAANGSLEADHRNALAMWLDRWIERKRAEAGSSCRMRLAVPGWTALHTADRLRLESRRASDRRIRAIRHAFAIADEPGVWITLTA